MSNVVPFDTLAMALALRDEAGFDQKQAEGTAKVLSRLLVADLVTKTDLEATQHDLKGQIAQSEHDLKTQIAQSERDLKAQIAQSEHDLKALIAQNDQSLKAQIVQLELGLKAHTAEMKSDLLKTIIGAVVVNSALILAAVFGVAKLLGH